MTSAVISLRDFKARAAEVLSEIKTGERTIVLTQNGRPTAVVQDYEAHQRLQQGLLMLKLLSDGEADLAAGRSTPQREVLANVQARLGRAE